MNFSCEKTLKAGRTHSTVQCVSASCTMSERRVVECSLRLMTPSPSWCLFRRFEKILISLSTFVPESMLASSFQNGSLRRAHTQRSHTGLVKHTLRLAKGLTSHASAPQLRHPEMKRRDVFISSNLNLNWTNRSAFMLGNSLLCSESCCTASWWAAFTLWATHTVYCRGSRSILGSDCRQNCCLLSSPSCRGTSGETSTVTPAWEEADRNGCRSLAYDMLIQQSNKQMQYKGTVQVIYWCKGRVR